MLFPTPQNGKLTLRKFGDSKLLITDIGLFRSPAGPAVPAQVRYRPFSFFHRSRQGVAGGRRGGRARSRTSGGRLRAGGLGWYAPSGLSFPLRFACGPLPLTRPRVAMPSSAPCLSGSSALRVLPLFLASQNLGRKAHFPGVIVPCVPSPGTQSTRKLL